MLSEERARAYLERIGFTAEPRVDRATLDELVYRHQCAVPFETVTLRRRGGAPTLESDALYEKIVEQRLGGYCFELNKAFSELLETIGFDVRPVLSRVVRGRDGLMPINHRGIVVRLPEGECSADVGFGGPMPAGALLLSHDDEQLVRGEVFLAHRADDTWWNVDRVTRSAQDFFDENLPERRQTELSLCTAKVDEIDFDALNVFCSLPGTLFRDHDLVNLRTENGYYGIRDNVLTKRANGRKEVIELPDRDALDEVLIELFGMETIRDFR